MSRDDIQSSYFAVSGPHFGPRDSKEPHRLEVLSWAPGTERPVFLPVMCVTRRDYEGDLLEVRTKMGRRLRTTPDHGWIVRLRMVCRIRHIVVGRHGIAA